MDRLLTDDEMAEAISHIDLNPRHSYDTRTLKAVGEWLGKNYYSPTPKAAIDQLKQGKMPE